MPTKAKKTTTKKTATKKTVAKKTTPKKAAVKKTAAKKTSPVKKTASKKPTAKKPTIKKPTAKKPTAKKTTAKKTTAKKITAKKPTTKKTAAKKTTTHKMTQTKTTLKKAPAKKPATKKIAATKKVATRKKTAANTDFDFDEITPYTTKAGESYMNAEQRQHIEQILNNWRQSLLENSEGTKAHMQHEAANYADPNDRASQEEEFSIELRTRDRERKLLKKIEKTLDHVKTDDFGYCDACGIEIGIHRLEARPTATLCIDCKTLAEIKERQTEG